MGDCLAKAAQVCANGYDLVTATAESTLFINPYERTLMGEATQPKLGSGNTRKSLGFQA